MIDVNGLNKRYGGHTAVRDVSFLCEPGTVTGFLGPNGAGKSTTLRMICGLTTPTAGSATVDGVSYRALPDPGRRVGVLLDAQAQHSGRTGREALTLAAMTMGLSTERVGHLLDLVGLPRAAAKRRVGAYSLGMRQRLGIAQALLGDPTVLILDEPANGLDPEGIHWMRRLRAGAVLQGLGDRDHPADEARGRGERTGRPAVERDREVRPGDGRVHVRVRRHQVPAVHGRAREGGPRRPPRPRPRPQAPRSHRDVRPAGSSGAGGVRQIRQGRGEQLRRPGRRDRRLQRAQRQEEHRRVRRSGGSREPRRAHRRGLRRGQEHVLRSARHRARAGRGHAEHARGLRRLTRPLPRCERPGQARHRRDPPLPAEERSGRWPDPGGPGAGGPGRAADRAGMRAAAAGGCGQADLDQRDGLA
ncbi:MAG: ATP-binding cassette domain-containing protein [Streptosporangiales bacterium]|nr:ATP-binding cassette domain-containing protein [Streptosporangiales bacterium]